MAAPSPAQRPFHKQIITSGLSGAIATTCIYPLTFAKNMLQAQKGVGKEKKYSGPVDVWVKTFKAESVRGIYKGWLPNVIFVMPEKALKLTLNTTFREWLGVNSEQRQGRKAVLRQVAAGGLAGFFQTIVTCPMELVTLHGGLMKEAVAKGTIPRVIPYPELLRSLGLSGVYTGVFATMMRDVPFSFIYFPLYATCNDRFGPLAGGFAAGTIAGFLATPMDVVKTRVQQPKATDASTAGARITASDFFAREVSTYTATAKRIWAEEGAQAFFKGAVPRMAIVASLFGLLQFVNEKLVNVIG